MQAVIGTSSIERHDIKPLISELPADAKQEARALSPSRASSKSTVDTAGQESTGTEEKKEMTLQERFKQFRIQRMKEIQAAKPATIPGNRNSPAYKLALRKKFVETAKKYMGVPYAQRYFEPGTPEYDSPLFLDCCALIRRVVQDLSGEFGFTLGKWNQTYQFDTLPKDVPFEMMQPGDLIFYSGTYVNPQQQRQKHDMVHVEIYLGPKEQTIGARWGKGKVSIFESYKFVPTAYTNVKHYFKSIDPWLEGKCEVYCKEHKECFRTINFTPEKKSIFHSCEEEGPVESCGLDAAEDSDVEETPETDIKATGGDGVSAVEKAMNSSDEMAKRNRSNSTEGGVAAGSPAQAPAQSRRQSSVSPERAEPN